EPVRDLPDGRAARRRRPEPAAPELLHGDSSAIAVHRIRRHDDSVRVRHRGADHRTAGRFVAARCAPLDDVRLAVSLDWLVPRDDLGVRGAGLGRVLDVGSGRERGAAAVVHGDSIPALRDGPGAPQHAARVERHAGHHHVLPDDLRYVHDAVGRRAVGACLRRRSDAGEAVHRVHGDDPHGQLRPGDLPPAAVEGAQRAGLVGVARSGVPGEQLTVAAPFFNKWMAPVGLALLLLTGTGPLLAWRKSALKNLRDQFLWPLSAAVVTGAGVMALGIPLWASGLCFALCGYVVGTVIQEFWRGGKIRRKNTGTDMVTAIIGLVGRNKRRYGGYIVHVGVVLICLGFAGTGSKKDLQILLKPGEEAKLGRYVIRNDGVKVNDDGAKQTVTAYLPVFINGKQVDTLYPAKWYFRKHEQEPTTEVAIRRTLAEDLYVVMAAPPEIKDQSASLEIFINPLVNWIWIGFGIIALGTGIALLPERAYSFAVARMPVEAAATSTVALML